MLEICKAINRRSLRQVFSVALLPAIGLMLSVLVGVGLLVTSPAASWAADYSAQQSSQTGYVRDQAASLVAPPDQKIAIYQRPAAKSQAGYGVNGDAVTVLERVNDNQSTTWHHVRSANPPYAEGWVQEAFIKVKGSAQNQDRQTLSGNHYLGNQPSSDQQNSPQRQSYSQRQN